MMKKWKKALLDMAASIGAVTVEVNEVRQTLKAMLEAVSQETLVQLREEEAKRAEAESELRKACLRHSELKRGWQDAMKKFEAAENRIKLEERNRIVHLLGASAFPYGIQHDKLREHCEEAMEAIRTGKDTRPDFAKKFSVRITKEDFPEVMGG